MAKPTSQKQGWLRKRRAHPHIYTNADQARRIARRRWKRASAKDERQAGKKLTANLDNDEPRHKLDDMSDQKFTITFTVYTSDMVDPSAVLDAAHETQDDLVRHIEQQGYIATVNEDETTVVADDDDRQPDQL